MRARLHVRGGRIGFMREGSHEICAVGPTAQMLPATVAWIEAAEARLRDDGLTGLTSIEIAENIPATERACHLELEPGSDARAVRGAGNRWRYRVVGAAARSSRRRAVVWRRCRVRFRRPLHLRRDARAFFQGNRFLLEALVQRVSSLVPDGPVVDLYAGVGLFGLALAAAGRTDVTPGRRRSRSAATTFEENARPVRRSSAHVERSSVEDFLRGDPLRCQRDASSSIRRGPACLLTRRERLFE